MTPTVGSHVFYKIAEADLPLIDERAPQHKPGAASVYLRNHVRAGQVYPAQVVAVFGSGTTANLMVQLDGYGQFWATSRVEGSGPGQYAWSLERENREGPQTR